MRKRFMLLKRNLMDEEWTFVDYGLYAKLCNKAKELATNARTLYAVYVEYVKYNGGKYDSGAHIRRYARRYYYWNYNVRRGPSEAYTWLCHLWNASGTPYTLGLPRKQHFDIHQRVEPERI